MKKLLFVLLSVALSLLSCQRFDDSAIWDELNNQAKRIAKLEELCSKMNTNISSMQTLLTALQNNDYVTGVVPITENGKKVGYTISFSKSNPITIYHGKDGSNGKDGIDGTNGTNGSDGKDGQNGVDGKDGANGKDGEDGHTPVIGVRQDADGVYYWTLDGEWLTDASGNKIKAVGENGKDGTDGEDGADGKDGIDGTNGSDGKDGQNGTDGKNGKDGITPELKIEEGYWYVSYDNGTNWTKLGVAQGESGSSSSCLFKEVAQDEDNVYFTLADNTLITLPKEKTLSISFDSYGAVSAGQSLSIAYTITGADSKTVVKTICQNGWKAKVNKSSNSTGEIKLTVPNPFTDDEVIVLVSDGEQKTIMSSLCFTEDATTPPSETIYTDLSSESTANSYIVSSQGNYKFKTVKGNSSESVGIVKTAEVIWESFGTDKTPSIGELVSDAVYKDNYISFSAGKGAYKEGNAVIAAKDAGGTILWSWHIWLTDKPEDQVYNNEAGTMMDRNLGATSATPGDVGALGLLYQWGRKDPFLGSSLTLGSSQAKSNISWPSYVQFSGSTVLNDIIKYSIEQPTTFISYNWEGVCWQVSKTIYDPCPIGYRVPNGGENGVWWVAFGTSNDVEVGTYSDNCLGYNFGKSMNFNRLTDNSTNCWYPAAGELDTSGSLKFVGDKGGYWSCTTQGIFSNLFSLNDGYIGSAGYNRSFGKSVRCLKE